ncbi:MAG: SBBP repeat-containing protein [Elusimicrobiota bacterium]
MKKVSKVAVISFALLVTVHLTTNHCFLWAGSTGDFLAPGGVVYDGGRDDYAHSVAVDTISAGGPYIYVAGYSVNTVNRDYFLIKYNSFGVMIASATYDSGKDDEAYRVATDNSGNVYVAGTSYGSDFSNDYFTIKYDSSLKIISSVPYDTGCHGAWDVSGIAIDTSGNVYVAGTREMPDGGHLGYFILKYNSSLSTILSEKSYHSGSLKDDWCTGIAVNNAGDVYVTGYVDNGTNSVPNRDWFTIKYDSTLSTVLSSATYDSGYRGASGESYDESYGITVDSCNVYVMGSRYSDSNGFIIKYDSSLATILSSATYSGYPRDIIAEAAGNVYVTGSSGSGSRYLTVKYNSSLTTILSSATYETGTINEAHSVATDNSGNEYVTGRSHNGENYDYRTIKYRLNNAPKLSWTDEENYTSDGLHPETGSPSTNFVYRVKYADADNDPPASDYPNIHILKGDKEISGSPFILAEINPQDTIYTDGKIYTYSAILSSGTDYTYYFEGYDTWYDSATEFIRGSGPHIITSSIEVSSATILSRTDLTETMAVQKLSLENLLVDGDLKGTISFNESKNIIIKTGSFSDKGVTDSSWTATLDGLTYKGFWKGMIHFVPAERKYYMKGIVEGDICGAVEGYIAESTSNSGVYDIYASTWNFIYLFEQQRTGRLCVSGTVNTVETVEYSNTKLYFLQTSAKGTDSGYYLTPLDMMITNVQINDKLNPYYGLGFSILSYTSKYGQGQAWMYSKAIGDNLYKMDGVFEKPLYGLASVTLEEKTEEAYLSISITQLDIGSLPEPDLRVNTWGPERASPGQTISYAIELRNDGLKEAEDITLTTQLPVLSDFVSASINHMYYSELHMLRWDFLSIPARSVIELNFQVRIHWGLPEETGLSSTAYILPKAKADSVFQYFSK